MTDFPAPPLENPSPLALTPEQVQAFVQNGVLVVDNILTQEQVAAARRGLFQQTLWSDWGVDVENLESTGGGLRQASSTQGSGGVLDVFYPTWKLDVATNPRLFHCTSQLWEAAYLHDGTTSASRDELRSEERIKWHPYGAFDCHKGYAFIDRIGFRLPTKVSEELGFASANDEDNQQGNGTSSKKTKKKKRSLALQRCLTPHLDCCPDNMWDTASKQKWRPIQCLVSLSDTLEANHGGFEAVVTGFHRTFDQWAAERRQKMEASSNGKNSSLCMGEYTHIRPVEDRDVLTQIRHVPVKAGSAIFWDVRVPHGNAYRHVGTEPRCVVYCSFLPDVPLNRTYVARQLQQWKEGRAPMDQLWSKANQKHNSKSDEDGGKDDKTRQLSHDPLTQEQIDGMTPLARRLFGIDPW